MSTSLPVASGVQAGRAHPDSGLAGEHRTHLDVVNTGCEQGVEQDVSDVGTGLGDDLARVVDGLSGEAAGVDRVLHVDIQRPVSPHPERRSACPAL
jgi:hypothetical protein